MAEAVIYIMVSCEVIFGFKLKRRYFVFEQKKDYGSNNIIRVILMHNGLCMLIFSTSLLL